MPDARERLRARAAARATKWDSRGDGSAPRQQQALRRTTLLSCVLLLIALLAFKSEIYTAWQTSFGHHPEPLLLGDEVSEQEQDDLQKLLTVDDISRPGQAAIASPSSRSSGGKKTGTPSTAAQRSSGANADLNAKLPTKEGSVAICLAGGLRAFQLTGPSIVHHLLSSFPDGHVFVSSAADETSHKLFLLNPPLQGQAVAQLKGVWFLPQAPLDESTSGARLLSSVGSPNGIQGLLQYFQLVEGCYSLITDSEAREGFLYDWVIRTRPDGFWTAPPPPLRSLDPRAYNLPAGSDWGGINDRIGITKRKLALTTLRRLWALDSLVSRIWSSGLNSETGLRAQLQVHRIPVRRHAFRFCTLTFHWYRWPPRRWDVPVFAITSPAPLNAAKCRPCVPKLTGPRAWHVVNGLSPQAGLPFRRPVSYSSGLDLCDASSGWPASWPQLFDTQAGDPAGKARREYMAVQVPECRKKLGASLRQLASYEGPGPDLLCTLRAWGPWSLSPPLFLSPLNCSSVVYILHSGPGRRASPSDTDWARKVAEKTEARLLTFWKPPEVSAVKVEPLTVPAAKNKCGGKGEGSALGVEAGGWYSPAVMKCLGGGKLFVLPTGAQNLSASADRGRVDVLRLGSLSLVDPFLKGLEEVQELPVCQLIVPFDGRDSEAKRRAVALLMGKGFENLKCHGTYAAQSCLFVALRHC